MLSRHFLRAKALQALYAGVTSNTTDVNEVLSTYDYNVCRLSDMGLLQMSTLSQLTFVAERCIELENQKFKPLQNDIDCLRLIVDNIFIERLFSCYEYKQLANKMKIDWSSQFDTFRKVINSYKASPQFEEYAKSGCHTFESDKEQAVIAFKFLMNDSTIRDAIFERDLIWEDDFDQVAQYVYMMLKELGEESTNEAMQCPLVYDRRNETELTAYRFARQLLADSFNGIDDVEPLIRKHLQNWDFERVALMDVLLINMAVTEFTKCPSIPERVTVDEYIELSKEFSTEKSKLFINGILDKILIELRVAGKVEKDERGMYDPELENTEN